MSSVRIAACIVTYRSPIDRVREAVASFGRCGLSHHLMVVDNDSGADYVARLRDIPDIQLIESGANRGFGYGHNVGIHHAPACDYYLVMNPDVVVHDGCMETMVDYLEANPDIGLLVPKVVYPDGSPQYLNKRLPSVFDLFVRRFLPKRLRGVPWVQRKMAAYEMRDVGYDKAVDVPFASGCFMLFRKHALDKTGGFDEHFFMYLEDCDMTRRVNKHHRAVYLPDAVITHHWARGSHKSWRLLWVMIGSMRHYFRKWGWKWL